MTKLKARFHIFYGWWIVFAAAAGQALEGGLGSYCFSIFLPPVTKEFGWPRGQFSLAQTISSFGTAFVGPFIGRWVDKRGPRSIMAVGALLGGISFALLGFTQSIWYFYLMFLFFSLGRALGGGIPANTVITNWFKEKRGLAMGVVATGMGWGGLFMVPLATWLILTYNWRVAYVVLGIATALILTPLMFAFMKKLRPEDMGLLPDGKTSPTPSAQPAATEKKKGTAPVPTWTFRTASRTWAFWLLWIGLFVFYIGQASTIFHGRALFEDKGASPVFASSLVSGIALVGIGGKLLSGYVADKMTVRYLVVFTTLLHVAAIVIFLNTTSLSALWAYVVLFGLALGSISTLGPVLVAQCFGRSSFGAIYGTIAIATTAGVGLGPAFFGYVYDTQGSYNPALTMYIWTFLLSAIAFFLARPPKPVVVTTPSIQPQA